MVGKHTEDCVDTSLRVFWVWGGSTAELTARALLKGQSISHENLAQVRIVRDREGLYLGQRAPWSTEQSVEACEAKSRSPNRMG